MAKTEIESINGRTIADTVARQAVEGIKGTPVELVVTFDDGTTATYKLYGEAVTE